MKILWGLLLCLGPSPALAEIFVPTPDEFTELSQLAGDLTSKMQICDAVDLLGSPTWFIDDERAAEIGSIPDGYDSFAWDNGVCGPVVVDFDPFTNVVAGWDEGRSICATDKSELEPILYPPSFKVDQATNVACAQ